MDIAFVDVEGWFYGPLDALGLPRPVETVLMAVVLVLFMIVVVRMTGGVARLLLGVLLALLLWHLVRPLLWF
jgi:hypothetical protein